MRYYGGTVERKTDTPDKNAVYLPFVTGTITVVTRKGREFTLYRADEKPLTKPAQFFMIYADGHDIPVLNTEGNDVYEEPYALFSIDGDILTEDTIVQLRTDTGQTESIWVKSFEVQPPSRIPPSWLRNGRTGLRRKQKGRPPVRKTA